MSEESNKAEAKPAELSEQELDKVAGGGGSAAVGKSPSIPKPPVVATAGVPPAKKP